MRTRSAWCVAWLLAVLWLGLGLDPRAGQAAPAASTSGRPLRVAAKPFTESYILSEMVAQLIEDAPNDVHPHPATAGRGDAVAVAEDGEVVEEELRITARR